jgi:hypothetical protein
MGAHSPTADQLGLLRAIGNGEIQLSALHKPSGSWHGDTNVTGPVNALSRAGWVEPGEPVPVVGRWWRRWQLTTTGRTVLDANPSTPTQP